MFCVKCGHPLKDGAVFCPKCGTKQSADSTGPVREIRWDPAPIPDDDKKKKKKKGRGGKVILALFMILLIAAGVVFGRLIPMPFIDKVSGSGDRLEGPGYSSADEAALAFANAYSKQDIEGMYKACAIESYVANMSVEKRLEWMQSLNPMIKVLAGDDPETENSNVYGRRANLYLTYFYRMFMYSSHGPDSPLMNGTTVVIGDEGIDMDEVLDELDLIGRLKGRKIKVGKAKEADTLSRIREYRDNYDKLIERFESMAGGDVEDRIVSIDIDGEEWYMFLDLIKYGNRWYVLNPHGAAAAIYNIDPTSGGMVMKKDIER
ncbi:MAG: zinc ribbon domain-containing protein [Lachnospiraceae bacterium]|nr:zinc ribbon domain-containing protein [Lachnospiraceae bacterium]